MDKYRIIYNIILNISFSNTMNKSAKPHKDSGISKMFLRHYNYLLLFLVSYYFLHLINISHLLLFGIISHTQLNFLFIL